MDPCINDRVGKACIFPDGYLFYNPFLLRDKRPFKFSYSSRYAGRPPPWAVNFIVRNGHTEK